MRHLISLFLVIATPTLGRYQIPGSGGHGRDDFRGQIGPSGLRDNFDGYGSQFQDNLPDMPGRGSHGNGGYLDNSQFGFLGPDLDNRIPDITGGSRRYPNRGQRRRGNRHRSSEDNSIPDSDYDSSMDSGRQNPRRNNYKDRHNIGWTESAENPFASGRRRPRPNGRKPSRRRPRGRDSSSEGSSASSRSSDSRSSSEENDRRRGNGRNRNVGSHLGPGVITFPGTDVLHRVFGAGQDLLNEAGNQFNRMGNRISDRINQHGNNIQKEAGEARKQLENSLSSARDTAQDLAGSIPGTSGKNGTAITLGSFKQPGFVKQFLQNIYNTINSWTQVIKQLPQILPGNAWSRFERMVKCMTGTFTGEQCADSLAE